LQDILGAVEALGGGVSDLVHEVLRGAVALRPRSDLLLAGREKMTP
jgi:hypothetical protein